MRNKFKEAKSKNDTNSMRSIADKECRISQEFRAKGFNKMQSRQLARGHIEGLNYSIYENKEFTAEQMMEIRVGLDNKLDVSVYANPTYPAFAMSAIRECMMNGHLYECFFNVRNEKERKVFYQIVRNKIMDDDAKKAKIALWILENRD